MNKNKEAILNPLKELSDSVDCIFYFICKENKMLKEDVESDITDKFSEKLGVNLILKRSGTNVQDPIRLREELDIVDINKVKIIFIQGDSSEIIMLSDAERNIFIENLNKCEVNTGELIYSLIIKDANNTNNNNNKEEK